MIRLRRIVVVILLLMMSFTFYGCNEQQTKDEQQLKRLVESIDSYTVDMTVTSFHEEGENILRLQQTGDAKGHYKLCFIEPKHLKDYSMEYDGNHIIQTHPVTKEKVICKPSVARNQMILSSVVANYQQSNNRKKAIETIDKKKFIVFQAEIPGEYKYFHQETIWCDAKNGYPVKIEIYNKNNETIMEIICNNFQYTTKKK